MPTKITYLAYKTLAELYGVYVREYVEKSPIVAHCGCKIHCYEHHFVHMVKLNDAENVKLYFPTERSAILSCTADFGRYTHEARRAVRLLASLECLRSPDMVTRPPSPDTADRAFIKEFDSVEYPFNVVLVRKEQSGILTLCTSQPVRKGQIKKWKEGEILFPKNTSATG